MMDRGDWDLAVYVLQYVVNVGKQRSRKPAKFGKGLDLTTCINLFSRKDVAPSSHVTPFSPVALKMPCGEGCPPRQAADASCLFKLPHRDRPHTPSRHALVPRLSVRRLQGKERASPSYPDNLMPSRSIPLSATGFTLVDISQAILSSRKGSCL